ncbi:c-type cytochrome [Flavobacterium sp.]|uniref:c-type cytochrome n=1 Tax=Flavobacterium sp. TaxID=239 RepID=UPI002FD8C37C
MGKSIFTLLFMFLLNFNYKASSAYTFYDQNKEWQQSKARGKEIYTDFCIQCHLANGKGTPGVVPPLDNSNWLKDKRKESIHAVKYGQSGPILVNGVRYNGTMTAMGLTDEEVADVMNYIMNSWSNKQKTPVTPEEVRSIKK